MRTSLYKTTLLSFAALTALTTTSIYMKMCSAPTWLEMLTLSLEVVLYIATCIVLIKEAKK